MMSRTLLLLLTVCLLASCGDDDEKKEPTFACGEEVSLTEQVMPVIEANCAVLTCHGSGIPPFLNEPEDVIAKSDRIAARVEDGTMPPSSQPPLLAEEKELILCWVEDGAPDN